MSRRIVVKPGDGTPGRRIVTQVEASDGEVTARPVNGLAYTISVLLTLIGVTAGTFTAYHFYGMGWGVFVIAVVTTSIIYQALSIARSFPAQPILIAVVGVVLFYLLLGAQCLFFPQANGLVTLLYWAILGGGAQRALAHVAAYPNIIQEEDD